VQSGKSDPKEAIANFSQFIGISREGKGSHCMTQDHSSRRESERSLLPNNWKMVNSHAILFPRQDVTGHD
jgi:hypothetical protein